MCGIFGEMSGAKLRVMGSAVGRRMEVDGRTVINFCTNNYLGLANDPRLKEAAKNAVDKWGVGPTAVRPIAGTTALHQELEEALAKFKGAEAVVTLQSGFMANIAAVGSVVGEGDVIFSGELNHASIIDACRLSRAKVVVFRHKNVEDLREKVEQNGGYKKGLVVTDGVFSMDGDIAPLPQLCQVAGENGLMLMVDDAHGEGVLGKHGRGIVDHFGLLGKVDLEVGTMSKAMGVVGGLVAGSKETIETIKRKARPWLFSSAMTAVDVGACLEAVKVMSESDERVVKLWKNTRMFKIEMKKVGFDIGGSETPIVPLILGEVERAREFSRKLFEEGVFATAVGYPTVPEGKARVRLMMSAAHTTDDLEEGLAALKKVGRKMGVI